MKLRLIGTFAVLAIAAGCQRQSDDRGVANMTPATHDTASTAWKDGGPGAGSAGIGPGPGAGTSAAGGTAPSSGVSQDDREFMTKAAQGGLLEVELGRRADERGAAPEVKAFGDRMVADHTKANRELADLASRKGVTLPTRLDAKGEKKLDDLSKLTGQKFDREYVDSMVDDHKEDVDEFAKEAKDANDPALRDWTAKTLPTLQEHLRMAEDAKAKERQSK
jgi:putative membrane protein